jgi:hypothetical protein
MSFPDDGCNGLDQKCPPQAHRLKTCSPMQQCSEVELWGSNWILRTDLITGLIHWWAQNLTGYWEVMETRRWNLLEGVGSWEHPLGSISLSLVLSPLSFLAMSELCSAMASLPPVLPCHRSTVTHI